MIILLFFKTIKYSINEITLKNVIYNQSIGIIDRVWYR